MKLYVLIWDGIAIAVADRMERISLQMAAYTAKQQEQMHIDVLTLLT